MTTYDFSMKSVMCYLENNERLKKKYVKGVQSRREGGGVRYLGRRPKYVFF